MKNKKGQIVFVFLSILIIILIIAFLTFIINLGLKKECKEQAEIMGLDWKYNFWIDCLIKIDDKWIKMDNYIINEPKDKNEN